MIDLTPLAVPTAVVLVRAATAGADTLAGPGSASALALAAVLAITAGLKLRAPLETVRAFDRLELPAPAALAGAVPAAELVVATGLLIRPRLGGLLALTLLAAFTAVILRTLARGLRVSCGCLGRADRRPLSWDAVVRNAALAVLAGLACTTPTLHRPDGVSVLVVAAIGGIAVVAGQLLALRDVLGRIWSVELAGEAGRTTA